MQAYTPESIRNVALMGHPKAGKTTLAEAMCLATGAVSRLGSVEGRNTVSDYDEEERQHGNSIGTSLIALETQGHRVNLLDTPGYADFEGEVVAAAVAADTALIVVDAVAGIEGGTDAAWRDAAAASVPARGFVISRLDHEHADFHGVLRSLRERYGAAVAPVAIPCGGRLEAGVASLVEPMPDISGLETEWAEARELLLEAVAETDDDILGRYLEGEEISAAELHDALRQAVQRGEVVPVFPVCAARDIGVRELLAHLVALAPAPLGRRYACDGDEVIEVIETRPARAVVFKTLSDPFVGRLSFVKMLGGSLRPGDRVLNAHSRSEERVSHVYLMRGREQIEVDALCAGDIGAIPRLVHTATGDLLAEPDVASPSMTPFPFPTPTYRSALHPQSRDDFDKMSQALARLAEQDPTLVIEREAGTGEVVLLSMGDVQAGIAGARLQREYGVTVDTVEPKIAYLETVRQPARADYRHKKQSGGRGQYGHVVIEVEPLGRDEGFEFVERVVGGAVPRQYIPAVHQGIIEALDAGPLTKSRLVDLRVTLLDGSSHSVDSSEIAFKIAAAQALHRAVLDADPVLLEPLVRMRIEIPNDLLGDITTEITGRRGNVLGFEVAGDTTVVEAMAPLAEVQRFGPQLRGLTHGRGRHTAVFDHFAAVPPQAQERALAAHAVADGDH